MAFIDFQGKWNSLRLALEVIYKQIIRNRSTLLCIG